MLGITEEQLQASLIGLGADGASVNSGDAGGVKALMLREKPWLIFVWCMAHRLELALKDALVGTYFADKVDNMLLRIYYLYYESPKKLRELRDIYDLMRETTEFDSDGVRPYRACGTRWIAHKLKAMERIFDKFGLYISHLEKVISDKTYTGKMRAKVKGYLRDWKSSKMLVNLAFYMDILEPFRKLSLAFQKDGVDTVDAASAIAKTKKNLQKLRDRSVRDYPHMKILLRQVEEQENGFFTYKSIVLKDLEKEIDILDRKCKEELDSVYQHLTRRLDGNENEFLDAITQMLNCEGWER